MATSHGDDVLRHLRRAALQEAGRRPLFRNAPGPI
jgi:hypothetical protein